MKKILAFVLVTVMMISSGITAFASSTDVTGSTSPTAEEIKKLEQQVQDLTNEMKKQNEVMNKQVKDLQNAIIAASASSGGGSRGGSSTSSSTSSSTPAPSTASNYGNAVTYGGNIAYQGGRVEVNGGKSNITFTITAPASQTIASANSLANQLGGSLLNCFTTSSPGASFSNAKVNFFISGVSAGDNIAVYQAQNGTWVQLPVAEVRQDHVVVNLTKHGTIAFVRVPVMASIG